MATNTLPDNFEEWTLQNAQEAAPGSDDGFDANLDFVDGDHWQKGSGWIGPMLDKNETGYTSALAKVAKSFVARNVIAELVDTHLAGVIGRQPEWSVTLRRPLDAGDEPTAEEQALIDEAEALLRTWWDGNRCIGRSEDGSGRLRFCSMQELLQDAGETLLATTRAVFRLVIDPAVIEAGDTVGPAQIRDFSEPADVVPHLLLAHPRYYAATEYVTEDLRRVGVYVYRQGEQDLAEMSYLDEDDNTVIRLVNNEDGWQTEPLRLGGRLTIHEVQRELYLQETIRSLQRALNLVVTLGGRNLVSGGFLERLFLNTSKPGSWDFNAETQQWEHTADSEVAIGEGTTNFLYGLPIYDEQGNITGYTSPEVFFRNPVPSETFVDMERALYRALLEEGHQLHKLIAGEATPSGESRIQAKDAFRNSLLMTKPAVDAALRWLMETLLALAADLSGSPGRYEELRVQADATISLGIATGEEIRSVIESVEAGLLGRASAMRRIGVEDVEAMAEEVDGDSMNLLSWLKVKAEIAQQLGLLDVNMAAVFDMLGFSEETVQELTRADTIPPARGFESEPSQNGGAPEEEETEEGEGEGAGA